MDLLEDPEIKKTYDKCKYIVKVWEHKFQKKNKRLPSKLDIREASTEVRHAYRKYFQLKSAALEQSFMDIDMGFEEDEEPAVESHNNLEQNNQNELNLTPSVEKVVEPTEKVDDVSQNFENTWGTHLNHQTVEKPTKTDTNEMNSKPTLNITKKLFCGSKFTKRNPRKSLTQKKSDSGVDTSIFSSQPPLKLGSFTSDEAISSLASESVSQEETLFKSIKFITPTENILSKPVNIANALKNGFPKPLKNIDTGWLERVAKSTGTTIEEHEKVMLRENQQQYNNSLNFPKFSSEASSDATKFDYDSDDIIDGSDEDEPIPLSKTLHVAKKKKVENFETYADHSQNAVNIPKETDKESLPTEKIDIEPQQLVKSKKPSPAKRGRNATPKIKKQTTQRKKATLPKPETPSSRRSSRQTKVKASFQELSSEEEDPFASDNDGDPEFLLESPKKRAPQIEEDDYDDKIPTEIPAKEKRSRKRKSVESNNSKTPKTRRTKKQITKETANEETEDAPYDLEFSVKPRIMAPRYEDLKKVITEKKIKTKSIQKKAEEEKDSSKPSIKDKSQQALEKLEQKIASGNLNENFVTINMKKKIYVRGKKNMNFSKYKKAQWKSKKKALAGPDMDMGGCDGGMLTCFKCGQIGHFARYCKAAKGEGLLPLQAEEEEDCPFPTLEEAAQMASESTLVIRMPKLKINKDGSIDEPNEETNNCDNNEEVDFEIGEDELENDSDTDILLAETLKLEEYVKKLDVRLYMDTVKVIQPYYKLNDDNSVIDTPAEVFEALKKFGHTSFRHGQEEAVMRILSGKSTLVTLSTGSGKSLCYQLPAYLYSQREPCISLIISPLVSLMEDQVHGIPSFLKAACLHTNQTQTQRQKILEAIGLGDVHVLLISPEAVVAGEKQTGFGSLFRKLPPIAFACIDEAHCVSQWSHNFRPSYLMICRVLRESLGVKTILGLTATATRSTSDSIIEHLQIPDGRDGIITDIPLPDNLTLTVSKDARRENALLALLLSERFADCKSIIIYCTRRDECERLSAFLRTSLKSETPAEPTNKKRKRVNLQAEPYHAGLSASRRRAIQNAFMSGQLRIVVATVAFGMGINKSDIRAVIHYNMPSSFESYVQEVGRAGRDGLKAHCHLFLDSQGRDEDELRRHIHANSIDRHVIRKLLQKIFIPCSCKTTCPKHEVAFSIEETVRSLDIPEENISTLLCYLELHQNKYIQLLSPAYTWCKVISYSGPLQIRKMSKECAPLAMALALHKTQQGDDSNVLEFPVIDIASAMGWESGICKHKLKNLEWTTENNRPKRSTLSVRFSNLGFRLLAPGNLTDDQLDEALDSLYTRVVDQEKTALLQLKAVHQTLVEVAAPSYRTCLSGESEEATKLKMKVREYFESPNPLKMIDLPSPKKVNEEQLVNDIKALICMYRDNNFTGRAVARIFHGIQSPNYPAVIWGRCKFWRTHLSDDFHTICKIAIQEILRMR